jgi:transcription initiation factor TFIIIB Brf1 subunit/transcription initiation factor TFIIB
MSEDILASIDAAVQANLCGCSCGQQIPDRGPSPDFVNEKHQQAWLERRAHHTMHARLASVTITIDESHTMRRWSLLRAIDKIRGIRP